jgi:hypothetical protein
MKRSWPVKVLSKKHMERTGKEDDNSSVMSASLCTMNRNQYSRLRRSMVHYWTAKRHLNIRVVYSLLSLTSRFHLVNNPTKCNHNLICLVLFFHSCSVTARRLAKKHRPLFYTLFLSMSYSVSWGSFTLMGRKAGEKSMSNMYGVEMSRGRPPTSCEAHQLHLSHQHGPTTLTGNLPRCAEHSKPPLRSFI